MSRFNERRKQKDKKRGEHQLRRERKKLELFDGALLKAGLRPAFMTLKLWVRNFLRSRVFGKPIVIAGPTLPKGTETDELCRAVHFRLREPTCCPDESLSPNEWLSVVHGLCVTDDFVVKHYESQPDRSLMEKTLGCEYLAFAEELRKFRRDREGRLVKYFFADLSRETMPRTQLDAKIYWFEYRYADPALVKTTTIEVVLHKAEPTWTTIEVDGKPRRAFRCKVFDLPPAPKDVSWPRGKMGVAFGPDEFPVYMQPHVLEQLKRRLPCLALASVMFSLALPRFFKVDRGRFLVECRALHYRLGYFAGEVVGDKVLLKTFLFLTMQGTPESDLLYKKLRLTRSDITYTRLDELSFFADPALAADADLRRVLGECGCGHLIDLDLREHFDHIPPGNAEVFRKYLHNAKPPHRQIEI